HRLTPAFPTRRSSDLTLSRTPQFSAAFAVAENLALISAYGNNFAGTGATGTRYIVTTNSIIQTSGDDDYFPGNVAGSATNGGRRSEEHTSELQSRGHL